ncbi:MAG TPA: cobyrinate a,c-diamide synthase, partial [Armatimonadota bacterium]|nr:cobyrinate a,c-diamide synthase [Armatimonadota bacterium]
GAMTRAGLPILGYVPAMPEVTLPSRHLGLVMADEMRDEVNAVLRTLGECLSACIDLDRVLAAARAADPLPAPPPRRAEWEYAGLRVAVARDDAFAFYYPENIELLEEAGARIVYFSPLADGALPAAHGLYLGGGYPELHAERLAANVALRASLAAAIRGGLPTYAECGGLLYLCESLADLDDRRWPMVGAVPAHATMGRRLQGMGYRTGILRRDSILGEAGTSLRGHEFHYSRCDGDPTQAAYTLDERPDGYCAGNLLASYLHLHFAGCPQVARHWLSCCQRYRVSLQGGVPS